MFDTLDKVREAWDSSKFVFLLNSQAYEEKVTVVLPSQSIHFSHFKQLREWQATDAFVTLSYDFCKSLEIPFMNTIYRAVSARYPIVDNLLPYQDGASSSQSSYSLSLDHVACGEGSSYKDMALTIQEIGDLVDQINNGTKTTDVKKQFNESFRIPGHVKLIRSSLGGLRQKISTIELSLALCEVAKFSHSTIIADLIDVDSGEFLTHEKGIALANLMADTATIDAKTVIDLWRSIFKVPKTEFQTL